MVQSFSIPRVDTSHSFSERTLIIPSHSIPIHPLCPLQALREFFDMCPAPASSPAFVIRTAAGLRSLSYSSFTKHLKDLLRFAGFNPDDYSGHSLRRGGATYANFLGISHDLIQLQGDWASSAHLEYSDSDTRWQNRLRITLPPLLPPLVPMLFNFEIPFLP